MQDNSVANLVISLLLLRDFWRIFVMKCPYEGSSISLLWGILGKLCSDIFADLQSAP